MRRRTRTVSFRLPEDYRRLLYERAARRGQSPGEYARSAVLDALADTRWARLFEETARLRRMLLLSQGHLEAAVVALLCDAGKASREEAVAFVERELSSRGGGEG